jgi:hypothetical protein
MELPRSHEEEQRCTIICFVAKEITADGASCCAFLLQNNA